VKANEIKVGEHTIAMDASNTFMQVKNSPSHEALETLYKKEYYNSSYIDNTIRDLQWWETIYKDKYDTFEKHIQKNRKKILDIGCGSGYFLLYGKKRGWECLGIEPSKKAAQHSQENGLKIINDVFSKKLFSKDEKFDVIHLHHVLEHVKNPIELLKQVHELLNKEGILCVGVPNDFSPLQTILWKKMDFKPYWIAPLHHLNYFNQKSLSKLLKQLNYNIVLQEGSFPMELFLLFGDDYISQPSIGPQMHLKRTKFDKALSQYNNELKRELYQVFAKMGLGRDIVIYAQKADEK
jgi:2-polyprenyl-3-methyl-5-hydroxy-6-metoxy-1,4-benzoquinol methylase